MKKLLVLAMAFGLAGCGEFVDEEGNTSIRQVAEGLQTLGDRFAEMGEALERDAGVRAVPRDALLEVVPERVARTDRLEIDGDEAMDRNGAGMSMASATYLIDSDTVFVGVADLGALRSGVNLALRWAAPLISGQDVDGDVEEIEIEGYPAIRVEDERDGGHLVALIVEGRFAVVAGSNSRGADDLVEDALERVDFGQLEDWREYGR